MARQERLRNGVRRIPSSERLVTVSDEITETQWKCLGTCFGCGHEIKGGPVSEIPFPEEISDSSRKSWRNSSTKWHLKCFLCSACGKSLTGKCGMQWVDDQVLNTPMASSRIVCSECWQQYSRQKSEVEQMVNISEHCSGSQVDGLGRGSRSDGFHMRNRNGRGGGNWGIGGNGRNVGKRKGQNVCGQAKSILGAKVSMDALVREYEAFS